MNLTDAFFNKRLLSIFKQCCEKGTRDAAPIRRCWRANVNGWGLRVYLFACRRPGRGGRGLTGFTGRTTAKSLSPVVILDNVVAGKLARCKQPDFSETASGSSSSNSFTLSMAGRFLLALLFPMGEGLCGRPRRKIDRITPARVRGPFHRAGGICTDS